MKQIGVFYGGQSVEHDISIVTAISSVIKPLEATKKFEVIPVYISKDGSWFSDNKLKNIKFFQSGNINAFLRKSKPVSLRFENGLIVQKNEGLIKKKQDTRIDVAFPAMHGTHGENGELMAVFELAGTPYVGCELLPSAIAMDKVVAKTIIDAAGIPTPDMIHFTKHEYNKDSASILKLIASSLSFPVFVKPARLGSSIGISKASDEKELENAIEVALHYDHKALVEKAVENLVEVTVPIVGNHDPRTGIVEQPIINESGSFDFDTKYLNRDGKTGSKNPKSQQGSQGYSNLPAKIPKKLYDKSTNVALSSYKALECSGIARIDLLIDEKKDTVYFNEVNPLPGSLYRHNWHAEGTSAIELVTELVELAEQRHKERLEVSTTFDTNFLKQF